jgi:hypothetical protein
MHQQIVKTIKAVPLNYQFRPTTRDGYVTVDPPTGPGRQFWEQEPDGKRRPVSPVHGSEVDARVHELVEFFRHELERHPSFRQQGLRHPVYWHAGPDFGTSANGVDHGGDREAHTMLVLANARTAIEQALGVQVRVRSHPHPGGGVEHWLDINCPPPA